MSENYSERAEMCFACGKKNPIGLQIPFEIDDEGQCIGLFSANENHVGYDILFMVELFLPAWMMLWQILYI